LPRLLLLTTGELTRDPRARRAAQAALAAQDEVVGVCAPAAAETPVPLEGVRVVRRRSGGLSRRLRQTGLGGPAPSGPVARELRGLFRIARLAALTVKLIRAARTTGHVDVVHAHDVDTLPAARFLSRRRSRLVYDAHELFADQEPNASLLYRRLVRALEGSLARHADAVVTVSEPIAEELHRSLRLGSPPIVVLNCPPRSELEPAHRGAGPLLAVYQGAMGPGRSLADLLAAARATSGVHLTIRVVNADLRALRRAVAESGLEQVVEIAEPVRPDRLVEALAAFHVGVVINRPVTLNDELVLPNKLFEYLMAGLAAVVPRLPGMAPLIDQEGIGLTYEPGEPAALGDALALLAREPERLADLRRRARQVALERYNAEAQGPALERAWRGG
jgi:glycosyltransferase involved in cell wall biosynthesis